MLGALDLLEYGSRDIAEERHGRKASDTKKTLIARSYSLVVHAVKLLLIPGWHKLGREQLVSFLGGQLLEHRVSERAPV